MATSNIIAVLRAQVRARPALCATVLMALLVQLIAAPLAAQQSNPSTTAASVTGDFGPRPPAPDLMFGDGGAGSFYEWDRPIPDGPPEILRLERIAPDHALTEAALSERILHTSRGGHDGNQPIIVSGTVYLPKGTPPPGGWPIIAWAHGTVGFADICAPSFNGWAERDVAYLNNWLKQGYAVIASDYEGLGTSGPHPYMMSRSAATGVLHAILAAQGRYPVSNDVVIVGQSQGAHAAATAGLLQPEIAPGIDLRGIVLTGWPGTMEMPPLHMDRYDLAAMLYIRFLPTYSAIDPSFRPESVLTADGLAAYEAFRTTCGSTANRAFMARAPVTNTLFSRDITPLEHRAQPYRAYPPLRFPAPVFLGIGLADELTEPRLSFDAGKRACALGSNISIHLYPGFGHGTTVLRSQEDSIGWVRAAFAGNAPAGQCEDAEYPSP